MQILYYFAQHDGAMYHWQDVHFIDELNHHNIEIEIFNPLFLDDFYVANSKLVNKVSAGSFDLFMTCSNDQELFPDTIVEIKKKMPTLLICFDNLVAPYLQKKICKYFDLVWLTSPENQKMFKRWGAKIHVAPYAANPFFFNPASVEEENEVVFIGTPYGSRANLINTLISHDIPVSMYGQTGIASANQKKGGHVKPITFFRYLTYNTGRKLIAAAAKQKFSDKTSINLQSDRLKINNPVPLNEMAQLYSRYSLALSSTTARNTGVLKNSVEIVNLRSFEIPMCGGIQICRYNKELADYFEDGKEIIFFENDKELIDKVRFYLSGEQKEIRQEIRKNARKRAEDQHSWFCRFTDIFEILHIKV